jgi:amino acid transporter
MNNIKDEIIEDVHRVLTYYDLLMASIGHIVGAGVFILIGYIVGIANGYAWVSVILSGLIIYFVSSYYIEAHRIHQETSAEYLIIKDAFGLDISNVVISFIIIATICILFVVSITCGHYIAALTNEYIGASLGFVIVIILALVVNLTNIQYTTMTNNFITGLGLGGLILLIMLGFSRIFKNGVNINFNFIKNHLSGLLSVSVWSKIIIGAFIFLFAYYGFDTVIKLNSESINPKDDIPAAIHDSIIFSVILYALICIVMISIMTPKEASKTDTPLADLTKKLTTNWSVQKFIELCGVLLTFTTLILLQTGLSRFVREFINKNLENLGINDGINNDENDSFIIRFFKFITRLHNDTKTPSYILILFTICIIVMYLAKISVMTGAIISNCGIVLMCIMVIGSVIIMNWRK